MVRLAQPCSQGGPMLSISRCVSLWHLHAGSCDRSLARCHTAPGQADSTIGKTVENFFRVRHYETHAARRALVGPRLVVPE